MSGLPLNKDLTERMGQFLRDDKTAPRYRLYALAGGPPYRPGLLKTEEDGSSVTLEVWRLPTEQVGSLLATVPSPLGFGTIELQNGECVTGFLCEPSGLSGAEDITRFGGWRNYLATK